MAIHTSTSPARAGERARSPKSQVGPVTRALRVMLAADPDQPRIRELRRSIADRIEADIALLDALDGDPDLEQDAGEMPEAETFNRNLDDEPSLGSLGGTAAGLSMPQYRWGEGDGYDREVQPGDDNDVTAPERAGKGFVRCGADDAEDGADAEGLTDDNGIADHGGLAWVLGGTISVEEFNGRPVWGRP